MLMEHPFNLSTFCSFLSFTFPTPRPSPSSLASPSHICTAIIHSFVSFIRVLHSLNAVVDASLPPSVSFRQPHVSQTSAKPPLPRSHFGPAPHLSSLVEPVVLSPFRPTTGQLLWALHRHCFGISRLLGHVRSLCIRYQIESIL